MIQAVLSVLIVATQPVKLAAPPLTVKDVPQKDADFFLETLAQAIKSERISVTTSADIEAVLGLERQRQLLGCSESGASCIAELANALGVDGVLRGSLGKLGGTYVANLKVLNASDGSDLASLSLSAASERELLASLQRAGAELRTLVLAKVRPMESVVEASKSAAPVTGAPVSARWVAAIPLALGAGLLVAAGALLGSAESRALALLRGDANVVSGSPEAFAAAAKGERLTGQVLLGVGAGSLVAALVTFLALKPQALTPLASVSADGAFVAVIGEIP